MSGGGAPQVSRGALANEAAVGHVLDGLRNFRHGFWAPALLGLIMLFDAWDVVALAFALPTLSADWRLSPLAMGYLMSAGFCGQFLGAVSLGAVAERFGRLPVVIVAAAIMGALALGCAVAPDYVTLLILRFFQGIMIGGAMPVAFTYVNELAPAKARGRYVGIFQTLAVSGVTLASLSSPFVVLHLGWRWMFGLGALPMVLLPLVWTTLPESPRWLVRAGRLDAANKALGKLGGAAVVFVNEGRGLAGGWSVGKGLNVGALMSKPLRGRTLTVTLLWSLTIFVSSGLMNWVPSLYVKSFHIPVAKALSFSAITSVVLFVALTISGSLIDLIGRRRLALAGMFFAAGSLLLMAALRPSSELVIFSLFLVAQTAIFFNSFALWPYTAEIYPTEVRALGLGYGNSIGRGSSMLMPIFVGFVLDQGAPIQIVIALFGLFALAILIIWLTRTRETAGKTLETT